MTQLSATPVWSVVIPLYNKQDFIEATLRSVLDQDGSEDLEVVVVDDGSGDEGAARVEGMANHRVRLIRQVNGGVSAARNHGIRQSRGQWVAFLDADDLWHPDALKAYRQLATAFPNAQALTGAYVRVPAPEVEHFRFTPHAMAPTLRLIENLPAEFMVRGMPFCASSIAIRRDCLDQLTPWFPDGESMGEDLDLWFRLGEETEFAHTSSALALYRTEISGSLMGQYKDLLLLPVWQRLRQRAKSELMPKKLRRSSLRLASEMEVSLARRCAKAGRRSDAWQHLMDAGTAALSHRWWVTLIALAFFTENQLQRLR